MSYLEKGVSHVHVCLNFFLWNLQQNFQRIESRSSSELNGLVKHFPRDEMVRKAQVWTQFNGYWWGFSNARAALRCGNMRHFCSFFFIQALSSSSVETLKGKMHFKHHRALIPFVHFSKERGLGSLFSNESFFLEDFFTPLKVGMHQLLKEDKERPLLCFVCVHFFSEWRNNGKLCYFLCPCLKVFENIVKFVLFL